MQPNLLAVAAIGLVSALLHVVADTGGPLGMIATLFTPLPLFIGGLSSGLYVMLLGGVACAVLLAITGGFWLSVGFAAMTAAPALWLTHLALQSRETMTEDQKPTLEWYPAGHLLTWTMGMAAVALLFAALSTLSVEGGIRGPLITVLETVNQTELENALARANVPISIDQFLEVVADIIPAATAWYWILLITLNMWGAQKILVYLGRALRPSPSLPDIDIPQGVGLPLAVALLVYLIPGSFVPSEAQFVAATLAAILLLPYFLLGLAVVHAISRPWPWRHLWLAFLYLVMIYMGLPALILCLVGLVEPWARLRQQYRSI